MIVAVVGGEECMRNHLSALCPQVKFDRSEVIVPFDRWSTEIGNLAAEFPEVNFHFAENLALPDADRTSGSDHRLYDRRRALGLRLSRGKIVAMTEDQAFPADDWVRQILKAHERPYDVVGGAVENGVDRPMNRALYYCDFGRYGRPFSAGAVSYLSDVNLAYKREALNQTRELWWAAYHETTVNWALQSLGKKLFLSDGPVVHQRRPRLSFSQAVKERVAWGRVFAMTRAERLSYSMRLMFGAGALVLPAILLARALRNMTRQRQGTLRILSTLPIISLLVVFWSIGEMAGYLLGRTVSSQKAPVATGRVSS